MKILVPTTDHSFTEFLLSKEEVVYNKTSKEYYEWGGQPLNCQEVLTTREVAR